MKRKKGIYERSVKRPMDVVLSVIALVVLSPVLLIVAVLVRLKLGSPVIFRQQRPGLHEKIFTLYKFRTMIDKKNEKGELLPDSERLTKFGKWLRSASLDELPELWNIIKGDMSIVGPRPLSTLYLPYYTKMESHRHSVRPGLSGLAQINGRNAISWEDKFELDLTYVNKITFLGDLRIIITTIVKVCKSENIGQAEQAPTSLHLVRKEKQL